MKKVITHHGEHQGVHFEICNWFTKDVLRREETEYWNYYLYISLGRIPEESNPDSYWLKPERDEKSNRLNYDYFTHPVLSNIDLHGGITFYQKKGTEDNTKEERVIKVGCDYSHYWDIGNVYNLERVVADAKNSIEAFRRHVPNYKYWCPVVGGIWFASEGIVKEDGTFTSFKGIEWMENRKINS